MVIAGVGLLITSSIQKAQITSSENISKAQIETAKNTADAQLKLSKDTATVQDICKRRLCGWERLHQLAVAEGVSLQAIIMRGLSQVFTSKGLPGIGA